MAAESSFQRLGKYRILKKLGAGAMGAVYLAEDEGSKQRVALKVPDLSGVTPEEAKHVIARFRREAAATSGVEHKNVCRVLEVGCDDGRWFLAMEYVRGSPLNVITEAHTQLGVRQAAGIVIKIAAGMEALHRAGVIHRDLKPHNVILSDDNEPVIVDFGLAKGTASASQNMTRTGAFMGTPVYAAPEQFSDAKHIGPSGDIYSLGVIFFELVTGRLPFDGSSIQQLLQQILMTEAPKPSSLNADLDQGIDAICARVLEKNPAKRYTSMRAFAADLTRHLKGQTPAALAESPRNTAASASSFGRKLIATTAALLAVATTAILWRPSPPDPAPAAAPAVNDELAEIQRRLAPPAVQEQPAQGAEKRAAWSAQEFRTRVESDGADLIAIVGESLGPMPNVDLVRDTLVALDEAQRGYANSRGAKSDTRASYYRAMDTVIRSLKPGSSPEELVLLRALIGKNGFPRQADSEKDRDPHRPTYSLVAAQTLLARTPDGPWPPEDVLALVDTGVIAPARLIRGRIKSEDGEADAGTLISALRGLSSATREKSLRNDDVTQLIIREIARTNSAAGLKFLVEFLQGEHLESVTGNTDRYKDGALGMYRRREALQALLALNNKNVNGTLLKALPSFVVSSNLTEIWAFMASPSLRREMADRSALAQDTERDELIEILGLCHPVNADAQIRMSLGGVHDALSISLIEVWLALYLIDSASELIAKDEVESLRIFNGKNTLGGRDLRVTSSSDAWIGKFPELVPRVEWLSGYGSGTPDSRDPPVPLEPQRLAEAFHLPDLPQRILSRMATAENDGRILLMLLASIPSPSARSLFRSEVRRAEKDGPTQWLDRVTGTQAATKFTAPYTGPPGQTKDGFPVSWIASRYWIDPAALLAVKANGHTRPPATAARPRINIGTNSPIPYVNTVKKTKKTPADIRGEWYTFTRYLVRTLCDRTLAVANVRSTTQSSSPALPVGLEVPEGSSITTAYRSKLALDGSTPETIVEYARLAAPENSRRFAADLQKNCRSIVSDSAARSISADDDWIDITWTDPSGQHSLDILLPSEAGAKFAEVLHILVPTQPASEPATVTNPM